MYQKLEDVPKNYTESGEPPSPPPGEAYKGWRVSASTAPDRASGRWYVDRVRKFSGETCVEYGPHNDGFPLESFSTEDEARKAGIEYGKRTIDG